jgi:signal transduction histidine kinase
VLVQRLQHLPTVPRFSTLRARLIALVLLTVLPGFGLVLFGGVRRSLSQNVFQLALVTLLVTAAAALGAELFVFRQVKSLAQATRRLAAGDLTARSGLPYGRDELGQLGRSFDDMATALQERQAQAERAEEDLHRSVEELQQADEERRRLLAYLTRAQEQERSRIASDIHDDSIQAITALGIRLEMMKRALSDPGQLRVLDELEGSVVLSVARLRHLLFHLRPPVLDREGLAPAIRMYLDEVLRDSPITYGVENRFESTPGSETRTILYRIAQEALNNVRKHARAHHVDVLLEESHGGFLVRIEDDGQGFRLDGASGPVPGHLGLTAMRERAELAGGWWRGSSVLGQGTRIEYWLPPEGGRALVQDVAG